MTTAFKQLLAISVTHAYYDGPCRDVAFTIPDDTRRRLRGARLLAKVVDGQLAVLFEAGTGGIAPLVSAAGSRLRFGLVLTNTSFGNFTTVPSLPRGATLLYDNATTPATLSGPAAVQLYPPIASHVITGSTRPVTVAVLRNGAVLDSNTLNDGRTTATFDLRGVDPGRFDIRETFAGGTTHTTAAYLDPGSQREPLFGLIDITLAPAFYTAPPAFRIAFDAREQPLRYYVVISNYTAADVGALKIDDAGFVEEQRPQITFARGAADPATAATLTPPGATLLLFESQSPVKRRASGRRKLQLKKTNDPIIENLPQPAATSPTSDLIVHLSKPKRA